MRADGLSTGYNSSGEMGNGIDANLIPMRMMVPKSGNPALFGSIVEFIQRFRQLDLTDRQMAIFVAIVLCQVGWEERGCWNQSIIACAFSPTPNPTT